MKSLISILLFEVVFSVHGARILFACLPAESHFIEIEGSAHALKDRGHEVYIFASKSFADSVSQKGFGVIMLDTIDTLALVQLRLDVGRHFSKMFGSTQSREMFVNITNSMITDPVLHEVKKLNFDLLIIDMLYMALSGYAIPYKLNTPYITSASQLPFFVARSNVLSYQHPHVMTVYLLQNGSGLIYRSFNFILTSLLDVILPSVVPHHQTATQMISPRSLGQMAMESKAFLLQQIPELDMSYPLMPNVFAVGGATAVMRSARSSLSEALAAFVNGGTDYGVVIMSLGSQIPFVPRDIAVKLAEAFGQLPVRIVLRDTGNHTSVYPPNVMVMKWLPQRELLAHKNTKVFITHGGNNGQMEAFVHAVPMIVMPIVHDQQYCGLRTAAKGYGFVLSFFDFQPIELVDAVKEMLSNFTYRENLQRDSNCWGRRQHAATTAADVVEAVLARETDHLVPVDYHALDIMQFYMLDCVAVIMTVAVVFFVILFSTLKRLLSQG